MNAAMWQALLFMVLPMVGIYVGVMVWSCTHDRWKR
jgi:uncharacterized membrane protein